MRVVLAKMIPIAVVSKYALRLWGGKGLQEVMDLESGKVLLRFAEEEVTTIEKILELSN